MPLSDPPPDAELLPLALVDLRGAAALGGDPDTAPAGRRGRLAITFLPGKRCDGGLERGIRHLAADARSLRERGVVRLLLLVEDRELRDCRVEDIAAVMAAHGIDLIRRPIPDMGLPPDADDLRATLDALTARIAAGDTIAIACRGGLGRSGTAAACLLVGAGIEPAVAIERVRAARPGAIETPAQEAFVRRW